MSCGSRFLNLQLNLKVNTETCKPILISRGVYRFVQPLQCVSNPLRSMSFAVSIHSPQIMNLTPLTPLPGHIVIFKTARFWSNFLQLFINLLVTSWSQLSPASGHDIHLKISKSNGQIAIEFTEHIYVTQRIKVYIFFSFFFQNANFPTVSVSRKLIRVLFVMSCYEPWVFHKGNWFYWPIDLSLLQHADKAL